MFLKEFTKNQKLALCIFLGISAIALSAIHARNNMSGGSDSVVLREDGDESHASVTSSDSDPMPSQVSPNGKLIFHVTGAVKAPGVYSLQPGKRIIDAINAAGGAKKDADLQSINLAAKIEDASQIYVPSMHDRTKSAPMAMHTSAMPGAYSSGMATSDDESASGSDKFKNPGDGVIHINSASTDELQKLPEVGPSTAQKIFEYRNQIGHFTSPEQILDVKGIGPKNFEKMRPFIAL